MHGQLGTAQKQQSGNIRFTSNLLRTLGVLNDVFCFLLAYQTAEGLYDLLFGYFYDPQIHRTGSIILCINYFLIRISRDGYSEFNGKGTDFGAGALMDFVLAASLTALVIFQLGMMHDFSRGLALFFVNAGLVLLFVSRIGFRKVVKVLIRAGMVGQRLAIYGSSPEVINKTARLIDLEQLPHIKVIGFADDRNIARRDDNDSTNWNLPYLGGFDDLLTLAQAGQLDQVVLALPEIGKDRFQFIAEQLSAASIDICAVPREALELDNGYRVNFLGTLPVFAIWQQPIRDVDGLMKVAIDRILACLSLLLLSPLLVATALLIKLESRGPILFRQSRFGFNNNEIEVLKFRSMRVDMQDVSGSKRTERDDPRVTKVGRFIRRTSIDELPQLWNVLRGDMSLVGPRPHATMMRVEDKYYFDAVKGYTARHRVKPGITGLAQVRGLRGEIATIERARKRVEYDIYYIENWSTLLDFRIMIETVLKLVWDKNAY